MMAIDYSLLKSAHIGFALASAGLFVLRGAMVINGKRCNSKNYRYLIHGIDTLLFGLGVLLAYGFALSPFSTHWLAAKLIAIVLYVLSGMFLMRAQVRGLQLGFYVASLWLLIAIFCLAIYKPDLW